MLKEKWESTPNVFYKIIRAVLNFFVIHLYKVNWRFKKPYRCSKLVGDNNIPMFVQKGDIILSYSSGFLTNLFIPGPYTHVGMFLSDLSIVESTPTKGVKVSSLDDFLKNKDKIIVLRSRKNLTDDQLQAVCEVALSKVDLPYDFEFDFSVSENKAFYCSELIWFSYSSVVDFDFTTRKILGEYTISPSDFYYARKKWAVRCKF